MHCTFVRDGKTCGAPTYQNPCASCVSKRDEARSPGSLATVAASLEASPTPSPASAQTYPLDYPKYRALHALLHHLWMKSLSNRLYDRREWEELEAGVENLARTGLGQYAPAPLAQQYGEDLTASLGPSIPVLAQTTTGPALPANLMAPISRKGE